MHATRHSDKLRLRYASNDSWSHPRRNVFRSVNNDPYQTHERHSRYPNKRFILAIMSMAVKCPDMGIGTTNVGRSYDLQLVRTHLYYDQFHCPPNLTTRSPPIVEAKRKQTVALLNLKLAADIEHVNDGDLGLRQTGSELFDSVLAEPVVPTLCSFQLHFVIYKR